MLSRCLLTLVALVAATAAAAQTTPPAGWTCSASFYSDDDCDCGCGIADPACPDTQLASCDYGFCTNTTDVPSAADPTQCVANSCGDHVVAGDEVCDDGGATGCAADCMAVDAGWVCGSRYSHRFSGCHQPVCGDGIVDGDEECDDDDAGSPAGGDGCSATCTLEAGFACPEAGEACVQIPSNWSCDTDFFGDGWCDCGCTAGDSDCSGGCTAPGCADEVCDFCYDAAGVSTGCEGEGEGEGDPGEGEGEGDPAEGEGEGEGAIGRRDDDDNDPEPTTGCASRRVSRGAPRALAVVAALVLLLARRRAT